MICPQCDSEFEPRRYGQLFCGVACRRRALAARQVDASTDWLACRLRQHIVRESWTTYQEQTRSCYRRLPPELQRVTNLIDLA